MHSTNYADTFIAIADDCNATTGIVPPEKQEPTIARMQYDLVASHPYHYTSDDLLFTVYAARNQLDRAAWEVQRALFFSKGQACLRASSLPKTYGWGIHYDREAKIALYAHGSDDYNRLQADATLKQLKAIKRSR